MTKLESAPVRWKWDALTSATSFGMVKVFLYGEANGKCKKKAQAER
jgi:hypothetical protein